MYFSIDAYMKLLFGIITIFLIIQTSYKFLHLQTNYQNNVVPILEARTFILKLLIATYELA